MRVLFLLSLPLLLVGQASAGCTLSTLAGTYGGVAALPVQAPATYYGTGYQTPALDIQTLCSQACGQVPSASIYQSYPTAAAFATPTYLDVRALAPSFRTYIPAQPIQRSFDLPLAYVPRQQVPVFAPRPSYGVPVQIPIPRQQIPAHAGFGGGYGAVGIPVPVPVPGGGGGGLAGLLRTAGDVVIQAANSPAGSFFLGAQAARGKFPFKK